MHGLQSCTATLITGVIHQGLVLHIGLFTTVVHQLEIVCSEDRAKRVSEARSQRAGQSRHEEVRRVVQQQQQQAAQEAAQLTPHKPGQPEPASQAAAAPQEHNLTVMIKADVQVCPSTCQAAQVIKSGKHASPVQAVACHWL